MGRRLAAMTGVVLLLGGTAAGGAPRETQPPPPPERTEVIVFDLDAFARSIADLPDPLPAPPTDGSVESCTDVGARPARYPLFDGQTADLPARRNARLCAVAGSEGPRWTLSWSGVLQDPDVPGTGGWLASGSWTLIANEDGWLAALGMLDDGAQFRYQSNDWDGVSQAVELRIDGRYLDRSRFFRDLPPLVVEQTAPPTTSAAPATSPDAAAPAQPVTGSPGYTG